MKKGFVKNAGVRSRIREIYVCLTDNVRHEFKGNWLRAGAGHGQNFRPGGQGQNDQKKDAHQVKDKRIDNTDADT